MDSKQQNEQTPYIQDEEEKLQNDHIFQFFTDQLNSDNMCAAEDVIFHGKLLPFNQKHPFDPTQQPTISNEQETKRVTNSLRKRSESLSDIKSISRTNSTARMRKNMSLDNRKLRRSSSTNSSIKSVGKSSTTDQASVKKIMRPRWFVFMFGIVKFPAEMELNDIKNRQSRMNPKSFLSLTENGGGSSSIGKGSWTLLKALSCKDHACAAVATAPFYMSHV